MRSSTLLLVLTAALAVAALLGAPSPAMAQGLEKATSDAQNINDWLWIIIPVICLSAGGIVGLLYSMDIIRKDTMYQWVGGVIFAGAVAGGIIKVVFG
ncbi:TrbC/VirB2 family protein [Bordetella genomosp. 11]|nr:TrbC/VirB2 family protein [Bordetella genomosp. 11]